MARKVLTITATHESPLADYPDFYRELVGILQKLQEGVSETVSVRFSGVGTPTNGSLIVAQIAYANEVFASLIRIDTETEVLCKVPGHPSATGRHGELSEEEIRLRLVTCLVYHLQRRIALMDDAKARALRELDAIRTLIR